jgi:membrane protein insertase Oxa1/YidC/SpoIIIJ
MPRVDLPFNLMFLSKYDLSQPSFVLNLIQSLAIFIFEALLAISSPFRVSREDVIRMQLILPVVSFLIFMFLPAGKKLFIITSLAFSIGFHLIKITRRAWKKYTNKPSEKAILAES